jgi:hypothetical protein
MSDVPRRRRGHRLPDPCTGEQLLPGTCLAARVAGLTRVTKTAPYPFLAGEVRDDRNAFRRVAPGRVAPAVEPRMVSCDREYRASARTVLTSRREPLRASARRAERPWPAPLSFDLPCGSSSFAVRDASDRLLPSHVLIRAPVPRRFPVRRELALTLARGSPVSRQSDSLRRAALSVWCPSRRALSSRRGVCVRIL